MAGATAAWGRLATASVDTSATAATGINPAQIRRDSLTVVKVESRSDRAHGNSAVPPLHNCESAFVEVNVVRPAMVICDALGRALHVELSSAPTGNGSYRRNGSVWSPRVSGSACRGSWPRCAPGPWPAPALARCTVAEPAV